MKTLNLLLGAGLLAACATTQVSTLPTAKVTAVAETVPVGTSNDDAADDPAIWRNEVDPQQSLIVGTDKKAGLYVYGLDGSEKHFAAVGLVNNVDLLTLPDGRILVGASDRGDPLNAKVVLLTLDPATARLTELARLDVGAGEAYGFCMAPGDTSLVRLYNPLKNGQIIEQQVVDQKGEWSVIASRTFTVPSQPEGCVVDTRTERLYVGEEVVGIWVFDLASGDGGVIAPVGNEIIPDVEGLALWPHGARGGLLLASSQGDNAYAAYRLDDYAYAGRFRIVDGTVDGTQETDGIAFAVGDFGRAYAGGLFVAQDGIEGVGQQNFKLVSGSDIAEALDWTE